MTPDPVVGPGTRLICPRDGALLAIVGGRTVKSMDYQMLVCRACGYGVERVSGHSKRTHDRGDASSTPRSSPASPLPSAPMPRPPSHHSPADDARPRLIPNVMPRVEPRQRVAPQVPKATPIRRDFNIRVTRRGDS